MIFIPLLVCIVGLLIYAFGNPRWSPIGKDMFWTGLLVTLFSAQRYVDLFAMHLGRGH